MPNTFVKIASVTVGSGGAASIDFSSIPSTYTDLCVKLSTRISTAANRESVKLTFNGNASNYSRKRLYGFESGAASDGASGQTFIEIGLVPAASATSNTFSNDEIYVPNYAGNTNKSVSYEVIAENNSSASYVDLMGAGLWSDTSAITSLTLTPNSGSFVQYSTATLYGIKNS